MQAGSRDIEPYWLDEPDWLCSIEFLPPDEEENLVIGAETIGYLFGYSQLTDTRMLAMIADADGHAYELLFSFTSPEAKTEFLDLIRSNEDMGDDYADEEFAVPTANEIRQARPLAMVLPEDVMRHATLIATTLLAGSGDDKSAS
jgi:hypothetical protein